MGEEIKQIKINLKSKRDVGKLPKTHNISSITTAGTSRQVSERQHKNINLNKLFDKPFTLKISKNLLIIEP
ncbi:hypothetical protein H5410_061224 [Solanum commersonii]|uniref:Uncharacterized protein n=1 Tax=Solanum commersonii TaxID=4109 RepID=A0A9J5W7E8_SOLCO|nr:hypothetical protein H5410_061224 [Solanum commersonii]